MIDTIRSAYGRYQVGRREFDDVERIRRADGFHSYIQDGGVLSIDVDFYRIRREMPEMTFRAAPTPAAVCYCWEILDKERGLWVLGDSQDEALRDYITALIREV